jgi:hypothetical protein
LDQYQNGGRFIASLCASMRTTASADGSAWEMGSRRFLLGLAIAISWIAIEQQKCPAAILVDAPRTEFSSMRKSQPVDDDFSRLDANMAHSIRICAEAV